MLEEAVLYSYSNVQAWIGSYGIDICEECIGVNNKFNRGSAVVRFYWKEEGVNGVILVLLKPALEETLVILPHWETLIKATKLGCSLQSLHHNIVRFEEEKLAQIIDINRAVASR